MNASADTPTFGSADLVETENGWLCILDDGKILPVIDWLDASEDECEPDLATWVIAGEPGYGYVRVELNEGTNNRVLN